MALLDDIKPQLRISANNTDFDGEITDLINGAKVDLQQAGLYSIDETDALIKRAIILYCKANFGYDNPEAARFQECYEMLKNHLSLSSDYAYYEITIEAGEQCQVIFDGETKETDDSGQVVFYSRAKNHVPYQIDDADTEYADITDDTTITAGD
jgi:hypothetical protein